MQANRKKLAQFVEVPRKDDKDRLICRWVKKCFENGKTVALRTSGEASARRLDKLLWTFEDFSFIPHKIIQSPSKACLEPVLICPQEAEVPGMEVLMETGGGEAFEGFSDFEHIIDYVDLYDETLKEAGRKRFAAYKSAGYQMRMVKK